MEVKHLILADETLQVCTYRHRAATGRSSGKYQVAMLQRAETAHIRNYLIDLEEHLRRCSALRHLVIDGEREWQVIDVILLYRTELTEYSRAVEALAQFPRCTGLYEGTLQDRKSVV